MKTNYKIIIPFTSFIFIVMMYSCMQQNNKKVNTESEKKITQTLNNTFGWAIEKDFDLFYSCIVNDSSFRSITPYNMVKFGIDEVKESSKIWADPRFKAIGHEIKKLRINISNTGNTAWFFCYIDDIGEWDGNRISWINSRWTGVLIKTNNEWRIAQHHFSFASEN